MKPFLPAPSLLTLRLFYSAEANAERPRSLIHLTLPYSIYLVGSGGARVQEEEIDGAADLIA